jgi:hypothetical protein
MFRVPARHGFFKKARRRTGFSFDRPLIVLQSDDWGRVGVRDDVGLRMLAEQNIRLGEQPYDFYSLETADDVAHVHEVLRKHRDSAERPACMTMNFLLANLDFPKMAAADFKHIHLLPLAKGLPGGWARPGLFDEYKNGIANGVFFPALHGLTHFCRSAVERHLRTDPERAELLWRFWRAETPYIYRRMPWIGYEYCDPDKTYGFLSAQEQRELIERATAWFQDFFAASPVSACAPGYRANPDTYRLWAEQGIRVAQNGSGDSVAPHMDENGLLHLYREIDLEPSQWGRPLEEYVAAAADCFSRGVPAVISIHSINFHSSLRDSRGPALAVLDQLLSTLESRYPTLLYVSDFNLYQIVTEGRFLSADGWIPVRVKRDECQSDYLAAAGVS